MHDEFWFLAPTTALLLLALAGVGIIGSLRPAQSADRGRAYRQVRHLAIAALAIGAFETVRYFVLAVPWIESNDLYYYLAVSRDMVDGVGGTHPERHFYFPGVYRFWAIVIGSFGMSWDAIKAAGALVLVANTVLVGVLTWRGRGGPLLSIFAAILYVLMASRLEGFMGLTEPIATVPLLAGLVVWGGRSLRGRAGWWSAVAVGAGVGLALYIRQQAGLLSLGYLALLSGLFRGSADQRHQVGPVLLIPVVSLAVFAAAVWAEGDGFAPLLGGLRAVGAYETTASFLTNVRRPLRAVGFGIQLLFICAFGCWIALQVRSESASEGASRLTGFLLIAAAASLVQFGKRPYVHYALLTAAMAAPAIALAIAGALRHLPLHVRRSPAGFALLVMVLATPFVRPTYRPAMALYAIPLRTAEPVIPHPIWRREPGVARDLERATEFIPAGSDALVLPTSKNEVHLALGTRSRSFELGYGYAPANAAAALDSASLSAVIVLTAGLDDSDREAWRVTGAADALRQLPAKGFERVATLPSMTIWRRAPVR